MATPNRYPMRNSFLTSIWVFHVFPNPSVLPLKVGGVWEASQVTEWTPFLGKSNFHQPTGEGTRWTACFELGEASRFAYLHSGMVKGTKNCKNGPNPHGKGNLSNKKQKMHSWHHVFSIHYNPLQSTTIHYATLSSALPCCLKPTAPVAAIAIRGPVCVPVAREKNHTRLGSKGSTSAEKVSPRLRNIRKPDSQRVIENPSYN